MPGLTAEDIVKLSCQGAQAPGYTAQAGQFLNVILADLAQTQDMELCRGKFDFNFTSDNGSGNGAGPYPLPLDYYRHTRDGVFFTVNGVPYPLINVDQSEYDLLVKTTGLENYPVYFYTDISPLSEDPASNPNMYVWQPANGVYPVTVRYFRRMDEIATPETSSTVPWFPNQEYLITALTAQLMKLTMDTRATAYLNEADQLLRRFMQMMALDDHGKAMTVGLDRRRFGYRFSKLKNTKKVGFF